MTHLFIMVITCTALERNAMSFIAATVLMFGLEKMFLNESALRHLTTLCHHEGGDVL